jgi:hypothetical protein
MKLLKFSTILTEESFNKLEKIVCKQYYKIESFVHESAELTENKTNNFIFSIDNIFQFSELINDLVYDKTMGYYKILYNTIQSKYEIIGEKNMGGIQNIYDPTQFQALFGQIYSTTLEYHKQLEELIEDKFNKLLNFVSNVNSTLLSYFSKIEKKLQKIYKIVNKLKELFDFEPHIIPFIIYFPPLPILQLRIAPRIFLGINFDSNESNATHLVMDLKAKAEVSLSLEVGVYIPPFPSTVEISVSAGLKGTLGAGKAGIKLYFIFPEGTFIVDLFYNFDALVLSFYVKFKISIYLVMLPFKPIEFYLCNIVIFGLHFESHKLSYYKFKSYYVKSIINDVATKLISEKYY